LPRRSRAGTPTPPPQGLAAWQRLGWSQEVTPAFFFFFFFFLFAFFAFFALLLSLCVFLEVPMTIHVIMSRENCVLRLFSSRYPTVISAWFESSPPKTIATCLFHVNPDI
ncbi:unnamed protein product, partial [Penicillium nalgiovense]